MENRRLDYHLLALALPLFWGCSGKYVPKADEEIYGTWTNDKAPMQKTTTFAGGWKNYALVTDENPSGEGTQVVETSWKDSEGSVWYKTFGTITAGPGTGGEIPDAPKGKQVRN